jgi:YesN/AraC family two-component response regulator
VSKEEIDEELADIRKEIEKLALRMQQNARMDELALEIQQKAKSRWVYEWPMRKPKVKWPVKELMARRQRRLLKGWLRHAENLDRPEEMVQICEPETGRIL